MLLKNKPYSISTSVVMSKYARVSISAKCSLALVKDHKNSFFMLSNGRSGVKSSATASVLKDKWLTNLKKTGGQYDLPVLGT